MFKQSTLCQILPTLYSIEKIYFPCLGVSFLTPFQIVQQLSFTYVFAHELVFVDDTFFKVDFLGQRVFP